MLLAEVGASVFFIRASLHASTASDEIIRVLMVAHNLSECLVVALALLILTCIDS